MKILRGTESEKLALRLHEVTMVHAVQGRDEPHFATSLAPRDYDVLRILSRQQELVSTEIAQRLGVSDQQFGRCADGLSTYYPGAPLIRRERRRGRGQDSRYVHVSITPEGDQKLQEWTTQNIARLADAVRSIDVAPEDLLSTRVLLEKLVTRLSLKTVEQDPPMAEDADRLSCAVDTIANLLSLQWLGRQKCHKLLAGELMSLEILHLYGKMNVGKLADIVGMIDAQMCRLLRHLITFKPYPLVKQHENKRDRRKVDVTITQTGATKLKEFEPRARRVSAIQQGLERDGNDRLSLYVANLIFKKLFRALTLHAGTRKWQPRRELAASQHVTDV